MEEGLLTPDAFLPSQWRDLHGNGDDPIKNLMRAMLEVSLRDATGVRRAAKGRRRTRTRSVAMLVRAEVRRSQGEAALRRDALAWIFGGGDGPFSFVNVCETLGIDAERLRARVCFIQAREGWSADSQYLPLNPHCCRKS
ncbi:MAG TPA: hypothetical protein VJW93_15260 [Candidatus Acidoferrales bacterium]|nr:hypothetical protein [Candidatus Acidoferrales bacterium]